MASTVSAAEARQASTASPAAEPPAQAKQPSSFFPLGYKEGFSQWWTCMPAATAEHSVLSFIPYLQQPPTHKQTGNEPAVPDGQADSLTTADTSQAAQVSANSVDDPYGPRRWRSSMVQLSGDNRALNEFSVERVGEKVENNLVVLHGYGAGLGFFYKNFESLSRAKGWQLYALDLLGMGRSTRPPFKIHAKERGQAVTEAEDWFIDALEEWRVKRKIERFTLMGHSLGGYMAVAYALKYPGRLDKLILASPVGIPKDPRAVETDLTEPSESTLSAEFTQDQDATTTNNGLAARTPPLLRPLPKWLTYLWDANVSPFTFVRWSGPLGPRLVSGWTSRRFSHLPQPESKALHDYAYSIFRMRGSGEYALSYILAPGAYARKPLINRIHGVGRQLIREPVPSSASQTSLSSADSSASPQPSPSPSPSATPSDTASSTPSPGEQQPVPRKENGIPVVLMYGDHDWMDVEGGHAAKKKIDEERERILKDATPEEKLADRGSAKVVVIKKAGHHIYLDGWEEFNKVILDEMKATSNEG
ncbi:abhydrolase domain-containing protein 4 [Nannizzia gypsea CBS 118893]|uniref:Abhydrolase domain-containing protein 4 n=1 Tax=Arthroderma gypseum (strain ATCC MYA-4604 / CBS 118893) TaxID=535722 RepID=E4UQR5_ARTGP|nr:abhydrolase domain-containing protein 4 [Nannizzia gypsea CBS 118893]EFR00083.1 abhydrolase domain-containing protein 4 [Nannizzia gypsea CBS 118893]